MDSLCKELDSANSDLRHLAELIASPEFAACCRPPSPGYAAYTKKRKKNHNTQVPNDLLPNWNPPEPTPPPMPITTPHQAPHQQHIHQPPPPTPDSNQHTPPTQTPTTYSLLDTTMDQPQSQPLPTKQIPSLMSITFTPHAIRQMKSRLQLTTRTYNPTPIISKTNPVPPFPTNSTTNIYPLIPHIHQILNTLQHLNTVLASLCSGLYPLLTYTAHKLYQ